MKHKYEHMKGISCIPHMKFHEKTTFKELRYGAKDTTDFMLSAPTS